MFMHMMHMTASFHSPFYSLAIVKSSTFFQILPNQNTNGMYSEMVITGGCNHSPCIAKTLSYLFDTQRVAFPNKGI